jgi:hypothetical protein
MNFGRRGFPWSSRARSLLARLGALLRRTEDGAFRATEDGSPRVTEGD